MVVTYSSASTASAATTSTAAAASASGSAAASAVGSALSTAAGALGVSLGSAGELDRDLALENGLSVQLGNGALGLGGGRESDESVANGAGGAGVGGDGDRLAGAILAWLCGGRVFVCTHTR